MIKLGVWERSRFIASPPSSLFERLRYSLSRSRVSLHLLSIPGTPSQEDIDLFERLMPHVRLSSGVYRTTYRQRFRTLNPIINRILEKRFSPADKLHIEDWAASDCFTSLEWARELYPLFPVSEFVASDLLLFLIEAREGDSERRFILEPDGSALQYVMPPFVVRLSQPEPKVFLLNWLLSAYAQRSWRNLNLKLPNPAASLFEEDAAEQKGFHFRKLSLVHPEALRLAKDDPRFQVRSHSVFERSNDRCQIIRTMNIYNRAYFSEERLRQGAHAVLNSLVPGGIWIVGRTTDEAALSHEVTVFRKQDAGLLQIVERIGKGSEIEDLAISCSRSSVQVGQ